MKKALVFLFLTFLSFQVFANTNTKEGYKVLISLACQKYDVPYDVALSVAYTESNLENKISTPNSNGTYDIGIFQLNSGYIDYFEKRFWKYNVKFNPNKPEHNIEMAIILLRYLYDTGQTNMNWTNVVAAYHLGLNAWKRNPNSADPYLTMFYEHMIRVSNGEV